MAGTTLQGHGRPNVFLAGQVGQKYKDLDSGLEYVCTGERGFIKVDGDDQSEMYNWELVESSGSTGGGLFTVTVTPNGDGSYSSDKTFAEIGEAYVNGMCVTALLHGLIFHPITVDSDRIAFLSWMIEEGAGAVYLVMVKPNGEIFVSQQFITLTSTPHPTT